MPAFIWAMTGIHLGYDRQSGDGSETILFDTNLDGNFTENVNTAAGANAFSPGFCGGRANTPRAADGCINEKDGGGIGVRAGYDWQFDTIVLGAVGEFAISNINDSVSAFSVTPARYTMTRELNWTAAIRLRAGLAVSEDVMPYLTAGLSKADVDHDFTTSNAVNTFPQRGTGNPTGHQFGGGLEWRMSGPWTVGAEYLYNSHDDDKYRVRASGPAPATNPFILVNAGGTDFRRSEDSFDYGSFRLTLTYRFGG